MSTITETKLDAGQDEHDPVPDEVRRAAAGEELTSREEKGALDFLLGPTRALRYTIEVQLETDEGMKPLKFHVQQQDGARLAKLETENRAGDGPFARLDTVAYNSAVVHAATTAFTDATGRRVELESQDFVGGHPEGSLGALRTRFKFQGGIFEALSGEIQRVSGYSADRVGSAQRVLVDAVGGS